MTAIDSQMGLALERTRLAYERTLMAWVRTAISLITFGFTIYKFFQLERAGLPRPTVLVGPRELAVVLILLGLVSLGVATLQHRRSLAELRAREPALPASTAVGLGAIVWLLGVLALIAVALRL